VELLKNGKIVKIAEYSVNSVVQERLASGTLDPAREKLNRALVQYGRYSQIRFNHKTENMPDFDPNVDILSIPSSYAPQADPTTFGAYIKNFNARINLAESVQIWAFLTPAAGYSLKDFDITISTAAQGAKAEIIESGSTILVKITGIKAYDMDKDIGIKVALKGTDTSATWTRSLISCAYDNYQTSTDADRQNLMKALYTYFVAAKERFNQA
jgi:hypothetical protein